MFSYNHSLCEYKNITISMLFLVEKKQEFSRVRPCMRHIKGVFYLYALHYRHVGSSILSDTICFRQAAKTSSKWMTNFFINMSAYFKQPMNKGLHHIVYCKLVSILEQILIPVQEIIN